MVEKNDEVALRTTYNVLNENREGSVLFCNPNSNNSLQQNMSIFAPQHTKCFTDTWLGSDLPVSRSG